MRVLLVGNGGREHAIAWSLTQSHSLSHLYVAPGNGGTSSLPNTQNVAISATDVESLVDFAVSQEIELTIVGPEAPLVLGLTDELQAVGLRVFGPTKTAAQLEGSKAFSKSFMEQHGIPTGRAEIFDTLEAAFAYLDSLEKLPVIKASGLAAGKGVLLPDTINDAKETLRDIMEDRVFGDAGDTVLIEERLAGPEVSVLAFCDGESLAVMPAAQDHKRLLNDDRGPNTGGMGAFAPTPVATDALIEMARNEVLLPTLRGLAQEGAPYVGVLYAGLMLTEQGPKVLEFNCRLGDPETQVILPLLQSELLEVMDACVDGNLNAASVEWLDGAAATIVAASAGYPGDYDTGIPISGIREAEAMGCRVYHAGTRISDGKLVTAGGRVLSVTGTGADLRQALDRAYEGLTAIAFEGIQYRTDIGSKNIETG